MGNEKSKSILLVEDEGLIAMAEKQQLEKYGYCVHHAISGEAAVKAIMDGTVQADLILMDIDLGDGMDGTQAAELLLSHKDIPILFLSSHSDRAIVAKTEKISSYGYVVKNSGIVVLDASIKMAFKLFDSKIQEQKKEASLQQSEEKYRILFNSGIDFQAMHLLKEDGTPGNFLEVSDATCRILGYTKEEMLRMSLSDIDPYMCKHSPEMQDQFARNKHLIFETELKTKTGKPVFFEISLTLFALQGSKAVLSIGRNITDRKKLTAELEDQHRLLNTLLNNLSIGVFMVEAPGGKPLVANPAAKRLLGRGILPDTTRYNLQEVYQASRTGSGEPYPVEEMPIIRGMQGEYSHIEDMTVTQPDGKQTLLEIHGSPVFDHNGRVMASLVSFTDITSRKQTELETQKQLTEKETLLREVHHRIKNNIATIESFLSLQASATINPEANAALQEACSRVNSMRVLYENLLLSQYYNDISIKDYTEGLLDSLVQFFDPENNIGIVKQIADFSLTAKKASSVGIIINEIMTNVFKYAFKDRDSCMVVISIEKLDDKATLIIHDNGVGIQEDLHNSNPLGFGLTIVKMLVEQLNGTYNIVNEKGTKSIIQFDI